MSTEGYTCEHCGQFKRFGSAMEQLLYTAREILRALEATPAQTTVGGIEFELESICREALHRLDPLMDAQDLFDRLNKVTQ